MDKTNAASTTICGVPAPDNGVLCRNSHYHSGPHSWEDSVPIEAFYANGVRCADQAMALELFKARSELAAKAQECAEAQVHLAAERKAQGIVEAQNHKIFQLRNELSETVMENNALNEQIVAERKARHEGDEIAAHALLKADNLGIALKMHDGIERDTMKRAEAAEAEVKRLRHDIERLAAANAGLLNAAYTQDAKRYRWLCDDLDAEARAKRSHILNRMSVMGKGAIDAAIDAAKAAHTSKENQECVTRNQGGEMKLPEKNIWPDVAMVAAIVWAFLAWLIWSM